MRIEKLIKRNGSILTLQFSNGETRKVDYTQAREIWEDQGKDLAEVAKNFNTAFVKDGCLCFKISRNRTVHFDTDVVYKESKTINTDNGPKETQRRQTLGVVSSKDVMRTTFNGLPFDGEWLDFLGKPARNFFMVLSAQPGHGKTTFCLKFANYLTKFGKVLYITNEENAERIKCKFDFIADPIKDFDMSFETTDFNSIIKLIKAGHYDFVFIDSTQYGGMDFKELREIRKMFPQQALIAISRQTKSGKTRGSQEKEYDGDITVKFYTQGCARTVKNRFWELSEFKLFDNNLTEEE